MNSENKCIKQDAKMEPKLKDLCFEVIQACPNRCKFCSSNSSIEKSTIITFKQFKKTQTHPLTNTAQKYSFR